MSNGYCTFEQLWDIDRSIDLRLAVLRKGGEMAVSWRVGIAVRERRA